MPLRSHASNAKPQEQVRLQKDPREKSRANIIVIDVFFLVQQLQQLVAVAMAMAIASTIEMASDAAIATEPAVV